MDTDYERKNRMADVLAYFLTWTTYGTWLHGDPRGSVDRHNACKGADFHPPNDRWKKASRNRMTSPGLILTKEQRRLVESIIYRHCELRDWELLEVNCRRSHVHILVRVNEVSPERVMREFKAYATRALRGCGVGKDRKIWTRGGSTRYIDSHESLCAARNYIRTQ